MSRAGSVLVGALIFISVLGFLWVSDFTLRVTEKIQTERLLQIEDNNLLAAELEWQALQAALTELSPTDSPEVIEYSVPDGLSERLVRLKATWKDGQWRISERQAVWRAIVGSQ